MEKINHELNRRVDGFRVVSVVLLFISLLNLVRWILVPTAELEVVTQGNLSLNLFSMIFFACVYQYMSQKNYGLFLFGGILVAFAYYLIGDYLNDLDAFSANNNVGIGRGLDYTFLFPLVFVVISILFLRQSIVFLFIIFYTGALAYDMYPLFMLDQTYFSDDWKTLISDGNAINVQWLTVWINVWVIICIVCWAIVYLIDKLMTDVVKYEKSTAQFGRYFSPSIREKIQESDIEINSSENTNKMVAVLFTDIDGFTSISENLKSSEVIELLSEYQDRMIKPIFKNSGTVDKFIGDAVMATFGTPISQGNDVQNAFNCAREMQIAMRQWAKERSDSGLSPITHRIGIHFGSCVVGNIGNEDRKEFTVIGDVVNVANRVCDACKDLETDFIITDEVKSRLNEAIQSETVENFSIRGKKNQITVHKVAV